MYIRRCARDAMVYIVGGGLVGSDHKYQKAGGDLEINWIRLIHRNIAQCCGMCWSCLRESPSPECSSSIYKRASERENMRGAQHSLVVMPTHKRACWPSRPLLSLSLLLWLIRERERESQFVGSWQFYLCARGPLVLCFFIYIYIFSFLSLRTTTTVACDLCFAVFTSMRARRPSFAILPLRAYCTRKRVLMVCIYKIYEIWVVRREYERGITNHKRARKSHVTIFLYEKFLFFFYSNIFSSFTSEWINEDI